MSRSSQRSQLFVGSRKSSWKPAARRRLFFESLEERRVLATISMGSVGGPAGSLDLDFSGDGWATSGWAGSATTQEIGHDVAIDASGRAVIVGEYSSATGLNFFVARYNTDGTLDTTFSAGDADGINGVKIIDFGGSDVAFGVAIDPEDGTIVVAGSSNQIVTDDVFGEDFEQNDVAIARLLPSGALDTTFNGTGKLVWDLAFLASHSLDAVEDVAIQSDNSIVVVGSVTDIKVVGTMDWYVSRVTSAGVKDTNFGTDGVRTLDFLGDSFESAVGVAVQGDDKIVVGGIVQFSNSDCLFAVARLSPNGADDTTFSGDGRNSVSVPDGDARDIALQADGKVVVAGSMFDGGVKIALARFKADGDLDTDFGTGGIAKLGKSGATLVGADVVVEPGTGNLVVAATATQGSPQADTFAVARFLPGGTPDSAFGTGGLAEADLAGGKELAEAVALDPLSGKIVVAGRQIVTGGTCDLALARFLSVATGSPVEFNGFEGELFPLTGTFSDPLVGTTHSIVIVWGDGTSTTLGPGEINTSTSSYSTAHTFADNSTLVTANIVLTANPAIVVASASAAATIKNVNPLFLTVTSTTIDENGTATITGSFSDAGALDTHTIKVNWGEGPLTDATINAVSRTFTASHQYLDDNPTGSSSDTYNVSLSLTDDDNGAAAPASTTVTVNNVAPVAAIAGPAMVVRGTSATFTGSFSDPGTQDTHQVFWDFGDGVQIPYQASTNAGALTPAHVYASNGNYTVTLKVKDDDSGLSCVTKTVTVLTAQLEASPTGSGTALVVGGTTGGENITVSPATGGSVELFVNSVSVGVFAPSAAIVIYAGDGDDEVQICGSIDLSAWLYGGAGNDRLKGGAGHDVLLGQEGNDLLVGGAGRDILIGGLGADRIVGNADDDILISGTTNHDANIAALAAILAEWTSNRTFDVRTANLSNGSGSATRANGSFFLSATTVHDDGARDVMTGSSGFDWFFAHLGSETDLTKDKITDMNAAEFAIDVDFIGP